MSPELERRLEAIVTRPPRRRRGARLWRPALAAGLAGLLIAVVVVAVGRSRDDVTTNFSSRVQSGGESSQGSSAPAQTPAAPEAAATAAPARRVERDASLTLSAAPRAFDEVTRGVMDTADRFGGIVQRSDVDRTGSRGQASFDLRIPASRLERTLAALSRLAHVRSRSAGSEDVTTAFNGAASRLADARAERRALLRALAAARTDAEIASVRARLADARRRLARAERSVARLRARTDFARVSVTVVTGDAGAVAPPRSGDHWTPGDAARDAVRVLEVVLGIALVGLAVVLPVALLLGLALGGSRLARRRRREAALAP